MGHKKSDNTNLPVKLQLRRHFLEKYFQHEPMRVLDCCQGSAVVWNRLRDEFKPHSYWGVDLKPKKGRLKIDSARILQQPGWNQNVIDIDTYGSPWKHWLAMLPNVSSPCVVFLTVGMVRMLGGGFIDKTILQALGITLRRLEPPRGIYYGVMSRHQVPYMLYRSHAYGLRIIECLEWAHGSLDHRNNRYIGLRLEPQKKTPPKP
jgi:hypothetical protein